MYHHHVHLTLTSDVVWCGVTLPCGIFWNVKQRRTSFSFIHMRKCARICHRGAAHQFRLKLQFRKRRRNVKMRSGFLFGRALNRQWCIHNNFCARIQNMQSAKPHTKYCEKRYLLICVCDEPSGSTRHTRSIELKWKRIWEKKKLSGRGRGKEQIQSKKSTTSWDVGCY